MTTTPVINCGDAACARERFAVAVAFGAKAVHIDVADGVFAPVRTGGTPGELKTLLADFPGLTAHVHLMVAEPEAALEDWLAAGAKRAVVHVEAVKNWPKIVALGEKYGAEIFLGIKREMPVAALNGFLKEPHLAGVHFLAVNAGFSGQKFDPAVIQMIKDVRGEAPHLHLSVDGGVNLETARAVKEAGADEVVSSTYIFDAPDPKKAYEELVAL